MQITKLTETKTHPHTIALFRGIISLWVIIYTLILLPAADQFYSLTSHIPLEDVSAYAPFQFLHMLSLPKYNFLYPAFIAAQIIAAILAGLSINPRLSSAALYFFTINLDNRAFVTLDGGNNLMHLILFFLIFASPKNNSTDPSPLEAVDNLASNLSLYLCRIQVVLVYTTAGLLKIAGPLWTKGVALYYTMSVVEYGSPTIAQLMSQFPILIVIATYGTLLFQISFPYMIWIRKVRSIYMSIGTLLHLQISFVMGLFMFGFAMCASYFCFYTDEQSRTMLNKIKRIAMKAFLLFQWKIYAKI